MSFCAFLEYYSIVNSTANFIQFCQKMAKKMVPKHDFKDKKMHNGENA